MAEYILNLKARHFEEDSEQERFHTIVLLLKGKTFDKLVTSLKNVRVLSYSDAPIIGTRKPAI